MSMDFSTLTNGQINLQNLKSNSVLSLMTHYNYPVLRYNLYKTSQAKSKKID